LRRALIVAGILFVLHGFVDVSAHRIGSLFVGLLVFSLALPAPSEREENLPPDPKIFRRLGVTLVVIGVWWLASAIGSPMPPTTADVDRAENGIDAAVAESRMDEMERRATAALRIAPINWHLYFQRAYAKTFQPGKLAPASNDFMVARQLESKWVKPCFDEGFIWLQAGQPDLCLDAWSEALRRAEPAEALELYRDMSSRSHVNEMVHQDLLQLAAGRIDYQLIFLNDASTDETKQVVGDILARDPDLRRLGPEQRERLFNAWWSRGDREELVTALVSHPDWLNAGWLFLAQSYADQKNFQGAWEIVARYAPAPDIPAVSSDRSLEELQNAFSEQTDNLSTGILLYLAQSNRGDLNGALATLRLLEKDPACPKYVYYLEAKLWAQQQQWELAWTAWWNYHATAGT
jgi:hypothetical protein